MTTKNVSKSKILKRTQFGDPLLRQTAALLTKQEVKSPKIQRLIKDMKGTLSELKLGIGLAAPQVGEGVALAVINIQPTKHRPEAEIFELVIINPKITKTFGQRKQMWEGCISAGPGRAGLFAKVPRYSKIKVSFMDEKASQHHAVFEGLPAHVLQHEIDHLNGILFVDKVKDTRTYMTYREYVKHIARKSAKS